LKKKKKIGKIKKEKKIVCATAHFANGRFRV
jgi:hypothetical protein